MVIYLDANNLYGNNIVFDNIYGYWNIYDVILPKIGVFLENAHFPALIFARARARAHARVTISREPSLRSG